MTSSLTLPQGKTYSIVASGDSRLPYRLHLDGRGPQDFATANEAVAAAADALHDVPKYSRYLIAAIDTETTGVGDKDQVWEIAAVLRDPELGPVADQRLHLFVEHDVEKASRLPASFLADHDERFDPAAAVSPEQAGVILHRFLTARAQGRPLYLLGAVPSFDERMLKPCLDAAAGDDDSGIVWHYRLQCVESYARGWLAGRGIRVPMTVSSDDLMAMTGFIAVNDAGQSLYARHTAVDDAQWALDWYDHLVGTARP